MRLATNDNWTGPQSGQPIDGFDMYPSLAFGETPPRTELLHNWSKLKLSGAVQIGLSKLVITGSEAAATTPVIAFALASDFVLSCDDDDHDDAGAAGAGAGATGVEDPTFSFVFT